MSELLDVDVDGPTCTIAMDAPRRNAMTADLLRDLRDALDAAERSRHVRSVVLTTAGEDFCAGGDIGVFSLGVTGGRDYVHDVIGLFRQIEHMRKLVIAAVDGRAFGGGFELALACDLTIASTRAAFALPESRVGAIPGFAVVRLTERVGRSRAMAVMLGAGPLNAQRALELGLVAEVVEPDQLAAAAARTADVVRQIPRVAIELIKAAVNAPIADRTLFETTSAAAVMWGTAAMQEGRAAFFDKRPPVFPEE